jgi:hypothetical protein
MKTRRQLLVLSLACWLGAISLPGIAGEAEDVAAAMAAAKKWLALTDAGKYDDSWDHAATALKTAVTKEQWNAALAQARKPMGGVKSREQLKSAPLKVTNAPVGEFVAIQFTTQFENGPEIVETIAPMRERDGTWKVSGYYVKPAAPAPTPAPAPAPTPAPQPPAKTTGK